MNSFRSFFKGDIAAVLCLLLTMVLFGLTFMFTRVVLVKASVFTLLSWRFFTAFLTMTLLRVFGVFKISLKGLPPSLLLIGLLYPVLYYTFESLGVAMTSAAESGVIISIFPVVSMAMAALFLKEKPGRLQTLSMVVSVLGAIVVVLARGASQLTYSKLGYLTLFGAVFSVGLFYVISRGVSGYSSAAKSYLMLGMGFVAFTAAATLEHLRGGTAALWLTLPFRDRDFLIAIIFLGALTSVLATWAQNYAIERLGVHRSSAFSGIATVVSILAGVLLLREAFTLVQGAGAAMILLGVTGVNVFGNGLAN